MMPATALEATMPTRGYHSFSNVMLFKNEGCIPVLESKTLPRNAFKGQTSFRNRPGR